MFHAEFPGVSHDWSDPKAVLLALTQALVAAAPGETGSLHASNAGPELNYLRVVAEAAPMRATITNFISKYFII